MNKVSSPTLQEGFWIACTVFLLTQICLIFAIIFVRCVNPVDLRVIHILIWALELNCMFLKSQPNIIVCVKRDITFFRRVRILKYYNYELDSLIFTRFRQFIDHTVVFFFSLHLWSSLKLRIKVVIANTFLRVHTRLAPGSFVFDLHQHSL
jgi:hypothetical protein